jgi:hypothetical protein
MSVLNVAMPFKSVLPCSREEAKKKKKKKRKKERKKQVKSVF